MILLCLLVSSSLLSALQLAITPSNAQPTWDFSIELIPAELYMGEWGKLKANITNMDCSLRQPSDKPFEKEFKGIPEQYLELILKRAQEMNESGWIKDYDYKIENAYGFGGQVYFDAKLTIKEACQGKSIKLYHVLLWFPWKKYPGRDWAFRADANVELKAFNPIDYILNGRSPGSSIVLEFNIFIPPDIYPEERLLKPVMDLRVHYPGWIDYTLEAYPTHGPFEIQPYRSFNLTVTDYDGLNPISGARVVIRRLMHYYDVREYITPDNGTIRIYRLKEDDYEVRVYWNSSLFLQESPLVHIGHHTAYDLASKGVRTLLFNVEVRVLDLRERPLNGARIVLDGVEVITENGLTLYQLVPNGNHSLQAYWMGVKLLDECVWIGYHPTISPEIKEPKLKLILPVDDLLVQAVDSGGSPLAVNFTVLDPRGALPETRLYSSSGLLNITQVVVGYYHVHALNCSPVFRTCAEASGVFQPGRLSELQLPLHSITLHICSRDGIELGNASVMLGGIEARADRWGYVSFPGIPEGEYRVKIMWKGIEVYDNRIVVSGSGSWNITADVYNIRIELKTADGRPFSAFWILIDPSGHKHEVGRQSDSIAIELVPRGSCSLVILDERNLPLRSLNTSIEELAGINVIELPVKDMVLRIFWSGGAPVSNARVVLMGPAGLKAEGLTDKQGMIVFSLMPFANYSLKIYYPGATIPIFSGNVTFAGEPIEIEARLTGIAVKVVDMFGNPLPGVSARLQVSGIILGEGRSGPDGVVVFSGIPYLGVYQLEVWHGPLKMSRIIRPGETAIIELEALNLLGLILPFQDFIILVSALAAVIAIPVILRIIIKRVRASARMEAQ